LNLRGLLRCTLLGMVAQLKQVITTWQIYIYSKVILIFLLSDINTNMLIITQLQINNFII